MRGVGKIFGVLVVEWVAGMTVGVPTWQELSSALPSLETAPQPVVDPCLVEVDPVRYAAGDVVLFRERNGWCPYSERVWLTLELGNVKHATVLIDNTGGGRPSWFRGTTPRIRWEDGSEMSESMDVVYELDRRYELGLRSHVPETRDLVRAFGRCFPKQTRPSSRAAYLMKASGMRLPRTEFERALEATDALLADLDGPLFGGAEPSAADVAWAPFLERYAAQLPALHDGLDPRAYPHLGRWYTAMDAIPAYWARVRGDNASWRKVLAANFPDVAPLDGLGNADRDDPFPPDVADVVWQAYGWDRDGIGRTPSREAATRLVRNRDAIIRDVLRRPDVVVADDRDADLGLRRCVAYLLQPDDADLPTDDTLAAAIATYLVDRICVPRDMGAPPASALRRLAAALQPQLSHS